MKRLAVIIARAYNPIPNEVVLLLSRIPRYTKFSQMKRTRTQQQRPAIR